MNSNDLLSYLTANLPFMTISSKQNILEYSKYECYCSILVSASGITCFLRMNTINDEARYVWKYFDGHLPEPISAKVFCAPLVQFMDEAVHLSFRLKSQPCGYTSGVYFKNCAVYGLPIYDGINNYLPQRDETYLNPIPTFCLHQ